MEINEIEIKNTVGKISEKARVGFFEEKLYKPLVRLNKKEETEIKSERGDITTVNTKDHKRLLSTIYTIKLNSLEERDHD